MRHYILHTWEMQDTDIPASLAHELSEQGTIYPVADQPDDGSVSYYIAGSDYEDDKRIFDTQILPSVRALRGLTPRWPGFVPEPTVTYVHDLAIDHSPACDCAQCIEPEERI